MNTVSTEGKLAQNKLCNVQHRDNFIYGYFINFDTSYAMEKQDLLFLE